MIRGTLCKNCFSGEVPSGKLSLPSLTWPQLWKQSPFGKETRTLSVASPVPAQHPQQHSGLVLYRRPCHCSLELVCDKQRHVSEWPPGFNRVRSVNNSLLGTGVVHTPSSRGIILKSQKVGFQPGRLHHESPLSRCTCWSSLRCW